MLHSDIFMSCPWLIFFASMSLLRFIMSHLLLYHVVYISHIWMQDVRLG